MGFACSNVGAGAAILVESRGSRGDIFMTLDAVTAKLLGTTESSEWEYVRSIELHFDTDHPQGVIRVGERYFLSSVQIPVDAAGVVDKTQPGKGYVIEVAREGGTNAGEATPSHQAEAGVEINRIELCKSMVYHPGGLASDGKFLYVPVSEYRADSTCHIYKVDVESFEQVGEPVTFKDHVGALSIDPERRRIYGMSWNSARIYVWDFDWNLLYLNPNPIQNVGYQDMDFVGGNTLACSGFSKHMIGDEEVMIGGIDLINATTWLPEHRIMVTTRSKSGRLLTNNAFSHRLIYPDLFLFFIADDDEDSCVDVYKV
jgi:hypothetical protein